MKTKNRLLGMFATNTFHVSDKETGSQEQDYLKTPTSWGDLGPSSGYPTMGPWAASADISFVTSGGGGTIGIEWVGAGMGLHMSQPQDSPQHREFSGLKCQ